MGESRTISQRAGCCSKRSQLGSAVGPTLVQPTGVPGGGYGVGTRCCKGCIAKSPRHQPRTTTSYFGCCVKRPRLVRCGADQVIEAPDLLGPTDFWASLGRALRRGEFSHVGIVGRDQ